MFKTFVAVIALVGCALTTGLVAQEAVEAGQIQIEQSDGAIEVRIQGELFTRYVTNDETKPMFYPVLGPGQIPMTRNYPMKDVKGEAKDHPHHKSLWLGHEVNGMDFWANRDGVIRSVEVFDVSQEGKCFSVRNQWVDRKSDAVVCSVTSRFQFGWDDSARWIDASHTFLASEKDLVFNDTKEGMFAIRTHPNLRLNASKESLDGTVGKAINSEGVTGKAVWGKSAKWVNYWGQIENAAVGVAIFDHPENFRHPTHWHAREYGLVAANPFGLHHFTGAEKGDGEHTLKKGESMTFRYRMLFHAGDHDSANLEKRFEAFANSDSQD